MAEGDQTLLRPEDDGIHEPPDDAWWRHETWWFWFFVPERKLGGWLYNYLRPNIGVAGGGCWIWDERAFSPLEVPYYANYSNQRPPEWDGSEIRFRSGTHIEVLKPLMRYRLHHAERDWVRLDLEFDAVMEPWVSADGDPPRPHHLDQVGRVTGELVLHGEPLRVDCLAIRDRTWAIRPEAWKDGQIGYSNAAASPELAFLAQGSREVHRGYLVQDGVRRPLVSGTRRLERNAEHGYLERIAIDAVDDEGRRLEAEGESLSRMAMKIPGVHGVVWTSLVRWTLNGRTAWGEDQDAWPLTAWSAFRRETRA